MSTENTQGARRTGRQQVPTALKAQGKLEPKGTNFLRVNLVLKQTCNFVYKCAYICGKSHFNILHQKKTKK